MRIGSQRTDVAVLESSIVPRVMVEVKIGVAATITRIRRDLDKICNTLESMKVRFALGVRAASVFQVHVPGRQNDLEIDRLKKKVAKIEDSLTEHLNAFAAKWPDFDFELVPLQGRTAGYVTTEIVYEDEDNTSLGRSGHATRYYAVLIRSLESRQAERGFRGCSTRSSACWPNSTGPPSWAIGRDAADFSLTRPLSHRQKKR